MEKKETKRYSIIEYLGTVKREYTTLDEYKNALNIIEKSNKRKTSKYFFGNITCEMTDDKKYMVRVHVYNRLTPKMAITELDNFTEKLTEEDLIEYFKDKCKTKEGYIPDINICYFENKDIKDEKIGDIHYERRIKYLPIMYEGDKIFIDKEYIKKCLISHAKERDYSFFKNLANEFCVHHSVSEKIEELWQIVDKCMFQGYDPMLMAETAYKLYIGLIVERDNKGRIIRLDSGEYQISRRRQRDFGFYIRDYNMRESKRTIPTRYNKTQQDYSLKLEKK